MVPPMLVSKWSRECFMTLPRVRVFIIDGLRTPTSAKSHYGVNEVKLRNGQLVREGLKTSLTELRLRKSSPSARKRWEELCRCSSVFVVGRDRAKLGYVWRHAYQVARCGRYQGSVVNSDSGEPLYVGEEGERRSEERRVGKECRARWWTEHKKRKSRNIVDEHIEQLASTREMQ